jgi:hypothetical protein
VRSEITAARKPHSVCSKSIRMFGEPNPQAEPYQRVFAGALLTVMGNLSVDVKEQTEEEKQHFKRMREEAERQKEEWRVADQELKKLIGGRTPLLYEGRERVMLRPNRPATVRA